MTLNIIVSNRVGLDCNLGVVRSPRSLIVLLYKAGVGHSLPTRMGIKTSAEFPVSCCYLLDSDTRKASCRPLGLKNRSKPSSLSAQ